jgi:hypothetical protein
MDKLLIDGLKRLSLGEIALGFSRYLGFGDESKLREIAGYFEGEQVFVNLDSAFDGMQCGEGVWVSAAELVFDTPDGYRVYVHRHDLESSALGFDNFVANGFVLDWLTDFQLVMACGIITIAVGRLLS